jgi:hypothetical protein
MVCTLASDRISANSHKSGEAAAMVTVCVGSCFKVRKDNVSSLVAEYLVGGFMRW